MKTIVYFFAILGTSFFSSNALMASDANIVSQLIYKAPVSCATLSASIKVNLRDDRPYVAVWNYCLTGESEEAKVINVPELKVVGNAVYFRGVNCGKYVESGTLIKESKDCYFLTRESIGRQKLYLSAFKYSGNGELIFTIDNRIHGTYLRTSFKLDESGRPYVSVIINRKDHTDDESFMIYPTNFKLVKNELLFKGRPCGRFDGDTLITWESRYLNNCDVYRQNVDHEFFVQKIYIIP